MQFNTIRETLPVLKNIENSKLIDHAKTLLLNENEHTQVKLIVADQKEMFILLLLINNLYENYSELNIFLMDSVERRFNQYRHHSFSISEAICLHKQLTEILDCQ